MMELRIEHRVVDQTPYGVYQNKIRDHGAMSATEAAEIWQELSQKHKKRKFSIETRIVGSWMPRSI